MGISHKVLHSILFLFLPCTANCNTFDPPPDKTVITSIEKILHIKLINFLSSSWESSKGLI